MEVQSLLTHTEVSVKADIPSIKQHAIPFSEAKDFAAKNHGSTHELDVYELLHVLFDEYEDDLTSGLTRPQKQEYQSRIRKDRLSKYLAELVWRRHGDRILGSTKVNAATSAILQLTAKNVHAACDALTHEKDFHLALLVAQIEQADQAFQEDIASQISAWRDQNVLSEMNEDIRSLYEILSGNTNIAQGKQNVPVEDRASTFAISEKYELDWIQAFALRLWYGKHKNDDITAAVADFQDKLASNLESATPISSNGLEDPLWVVLKIFASGGASQAKAGKVVPTKIETPVLPQALSALSRSWNSDRIFALHHALGATLPELVIDQGKADDLALTLAFEHAARGSVIGAIYALFHLSDPAKRVSEIRNLLDRYASVLPTPPSSRAPASPLWTALTTNFHIPTTWIYHAKALYARSFNEPLAEFHYLVLATDYVQAHDCLLRRIAPRYVIDEDWESLGDVISRLGNDAAQKVDMAIAASTEHQVCPEWKNGGQIYADFVELMTLMDSSLSDPHRSGEDANAKQTKKAKLLQRLHTSLTDYNIRSKGNFSSSGSGAGTLDLSQDREKLEEHVAFCQMGKAVARVIELESDGGVGAKVRRQKLYPMI